MAPKKSGYLGIQTMPFVATSQFQGPPRSRAPCTFSQPPTQDIWQSQSPQPLPQQFRHCAERHGPSICVVRVADGAFVRKFDIWTSANRLAYAHTFHIFHSMTHSRHWLFPDTRAPRQATATIQHHSTVRVWCDAARAARRRRMAPLQCALTMQLSISLKRARRGAHCKHNLDICLSANCLRRARKLDFLSSPITCKTPIPPHQIKSAMPFQVSWPAASDIHHLVCFHRPCVVRRRARSASAAHGSKERAEHASSELRTCLHIPIHQACVAWRALQTQT